MKKYPSLVILTTGGVQQEMSDLADHAVNCIITLAKKILIKKLKIMIINGDQIFMKTL